MHRSLNAILSKTPTKTGTISQTRHKTLIISTKHSEQLFINERYSRFYLSCKDMRKDAHSYGI